MNDGVSIRTFVDGDEEGWLRVLKEAYGNLDDRSLDDIGRLVKSEGFDRSGLFLAEADQGPVGSIRIVPLQRKGRYEFWDLAVLRGHQQSDVPGLLVEHALSHLRNTKAQLVRGYTLSIEPYVSTYKEHGFTSVRRMLRIDWNLRAELPKLPAREDVSIKEALSYDPQKITDLFVRALRPFWDWWIEDHGGTDELTKLGEGWFEERENWFVAELEGELVGLTGFVVGRGSVGHFFGVMVLPQHRRGRIGYALLKVALEEAREAGLKVLRVYTLAFLDHLAPGATLYLKSGGKVTGEYLQLEKKLL